LMVVRMAYRWNSSCDVRKLGCSVLGWDLKVQQRLHDIEQDNDQCKEQDFLKHKHCVYRR